MKCLVLLAVLGGWATSLLAGEYPSAPITPGTYLLVYKDNAANGAMSSVKVTLAEQKDKGLTVQSERVDDLDAPAAPAPVIQQDGRFTFTLAFTLPDREPGGKKTALLPCTFLGWADFIQNPANGEMKLKPGVFRGGMSQIGESTSFLGDFLLYRLSDK